MFVKFWIIRDFLECGAHSSADYQIAETKSSGDETARPIVRSATELSSTGSADTDHLAEVADTTETKDTIQCSKPVAATEDLQGKNWPLRSTI